MRRDRRALHRVESEEGMDRPGNEPFVDIQTTHACVDNTYVAHRGPPEHNARNRFFVLESLSATRRRRKTDPKCIFFEKRGESIHKILLLVAPDDALSDSSVFELDSSYDVGEIWWVFVGIHKRFYNPISEYE